ncbi:MmgE/PrpD family protein [Microbaculum marinum]|uniref:MmgE/PrpD family protein n=1 Tax=Microbaculum marinum TaxID=1764581 RepID=A0AAW9RFF7_9HYPH
MTGLTRQAADFVASITYEAIPDRLTDAAKSGMTDCVAVTIAGCEEEAVRLVAGIVSPAAGIDGAAPLIPSGDLYSAPDAALVNGVAGHALDYDDVGMDGHPSAAMTPAILAEGWALGVSGQRALAAYVAGYELWALLKALEPGIMHERGFHPTAVMGTISAAGACAVLHGLDAERAGHAIGIAASLASGLVANFGTMTKPLHAGRTAQNGVIAARLAQAGFTAAPDILEHRTGFMMAHSASGTPDIADRDHGLGRTWRMAELGINIKGYPLCYCTHRAIDAMLDIVNDNDLKPDDVREIRVGAGTPELLILRNHTPKTGLEAKFSMEFAMASSLVARRVGIAELSDGFVARPEVIGAMEKVKLAAIHDGLGGLPDAPPDTVEVETVSGQVLTHAPVQYARGSWQLPLDRDGLKAKFRDCVTGRLPVPQSDGLFGAMMALEEIADLKELPLSEAAATRLRSA